MSRDRPSRRQGVRPAGRPTDPADPDPDPRQQGVRPAGRPTDRADGCRADGCQAPRQPGRYSSGTAKAPDFDVADAFIALCTAILHAEGVCRPILAPVPMWAERLVREWEGAIWVPALTTSAPAQAVPARPLP